jgi:hypothetical protein
MLPQMSDLIPDLALAADAIRRADALLITAGAGMGVDSGLPDFRGNEGFWRAYPAFAKLGLRFDELANPRWFASDPSLAWGFYGHRLNLYRTTTPHDGFAILLQWATESLAVTLCSPPMSMDTSKRQGLRRTASWNATAQSFTANVAAAALKPG